jgi:hypothetical protein
MPIGTATGYPQYSGVLIPEVWSGKLLVQYYEATALSQIANTEYEGEIKKYGDKVHIRTLPDVDVRDYVKGVDLEYQNPEPDVVDLDIDHGKYWAFGTDDVDKYQSDMNYVDDWTQHAGMVTARKMERGVYADTIADADSHNSGNSAGKISGTIKLGALGGANGANHVGLTAGASGTGNKRNVLDFIVDCGVVLDEQDVPEDNRWMILPAYATGLIATSDLKNVYVSGDNTSILRNKRIGDIYGFTIYQSNMLYTAIDTTSTSSTPTVTHGLFGHKSSLTWAAQFTENDVIKSERSFGWKYRGLNVYGFKVIKPEGFGTAVIRRALTTDT